MKQLTAKLKSRGATAAVLTLALGAAVYLNWSFSRGAPPSLLVSDTTADAVETAAAAPVTDQLAVEAAAAAEDTETSAVDDADKNYGEAQLVSVNQDSGTEFFESARLTRSKARDEALDTLKKSLKDAGLTKEEKDALTAELSARISNITLETKLETLIKSKGFPDCVVNLEGSKANVIPPCAHLPDVCVQPLPAQVAAVAIPQQPHRAPTSCRPNGLPVDMLYNRGSFSDR